MKILTFSNMVDVGLVSIAFAFGYLVMVVDYFEDQYNILGSAITWTIAGIRIGYGKRKREDLKDMQDELKLLKTALGTIENYDENVKRLFQM